MIEPKPFSSDYVLSVRDDTHKYIRKLLAEVHRLRGLVERALNEVQRLSQDNAAINTRLGAQKRELSQFRSERQQLEQQLAASTSEREDLLRDFSEIEQRNNDLATLYVAIHRLHGTLDEQGVLTAIEEIVVNLVGCEHFGLFELDPVAGEMRLLRASGLSGRLDRPLDFSRGVLGRAVRTGEVILGGGAEAEPSLAHEHGLTACVPLRVGKRVCGALLLFELLPQKDDRLATVDTELLALLASQAGAALEASRLLSRTMAGVS